MNVNDLVVQGAEALFFLDCYSCSNLEVEVAAKFISGVSEGCRQANCALIGGETAEMPGMYQPGDYDAVGAAIGAIAHGKLLPNFDAMKEGDVLLGLKSNGAHSNGFSLIRKIMDRSGLSYESKAPWDESTSIGLSLLTPTRIYVKPLLPVCKKDLIKGMSHITGGGLTENIPRMLPKHLSAYVDVTRWELSPMFKWLKKSGNVKSEEFARAWNTGLGMVIVVDKDHVEQVVKELTSAGEMVYTIGDLRARKEDEGCVLEKLNTWDN